MPADKFLAVDVGGTSVKSGFVVDGQVEEVLREPVAPDFDGCSLNSSVSLGKPTTGAFAFRVSSRTAR